MTNPVTKYELRDFSPDDISKLMENFFDIVSWAQYEAVHTHHLQVVAVTTPIVVANTTGSVTGVTYPTPFPAGVTPTVIGSISQTGATPSGVAALVVGARNITNTSFDAFFFNPFTSNTVAGGTAKYICFDDTYNTSLA